MADGGFFFFPDTRISKRKYKEDVCLKAHDGRSLQHIL